MHSPSGRLPQWTHTASLHFALHEISGARVEARAWSWKSVKQAKGQKWVKGEERREDEGHEEWTTNPTISECSFPRFPTRMCTRLWAPWRQGPGVTLSSLCGAHCFISIKWNLPIGAFSSPPLPGCQAVSLPSPWFANQEEQRRINSATTLFKCSP